MRNVILPTCTLYVVGHLMSLYNTEIARLLVYCLLIDLPVADIFFVTGRRC